MASPGLDFQNFTTMFNVIEANQVSGICDKWQILWKKFTKAFVFSSNDFEQEETAE